MSKLKMAVGVCHCVFVVAIVFTIVILTDKNILKEVLAQIGGDDNQVTISTADAGTFVGVKKTVELDPNDVPRTYFAFKGVPYAVPPVGPLRWKVSLKHLFHLCFNYT